MDGSPSLVRGHVRNMCSRGVMQGILPITSSLHQSVIMRETPEGNVLFIYPFFLKGLMVTIKEQV